MSIIQTILNQKAHRPYDMPSGKWKFYQEWNRLIFLHYEVSYDVLRPLVPSRFHLDHFEGKCYISIVPFTMEKIRPRNLPSVSFISDFDEINVRTYIENDGRKGVYFLNIEAGKLLSAYISKTISGLPYEKAKVKRTSNSYQVINKRKGFSLDVNFKIGEAIHEKTALDVWLTERYCLYLDQKDRFYRFEIQHEEWKLNRIHFDHLHLAYQFGAFSTQQVPNLAHYSPGIQVVAWGKELL